jgi:hypothetical protein
MHILDLRRAVRPALVLVALVALWAALVPAGAHAAPDLRAQADEIMKKDYNSFVAYKRSVHPAPFNWSDDGCSGPFLIRPVYRSLFNRPCQLHDFGYRNYGGGLRLGRNENARAWIDARFLSEMRRLCTSKWGVLNPHRHTCLAQAGAVWTGVRHGGRGAFYH